MIHALLIASLIWLVGSTARKPPPQPAVPLDTATDTMFAQLHRGSSGLQCRTRATDVAPMVADVKRAAVDPSHARLRLVLPHLDTMQVTAVFIATVCQAAAHLVNRYYGEPAGHPVLLYLIRAGPADVIVDDRLIDIGHTRLVVADSGLHRILSTLVDTVR